MKATTEHTYLEIYVRLCIVLFRHYNDKENKEMNFKKLLLNKCEKQFFKMQQLSEEERASRRASQQADELLQDPLEGEFNKQMIFVFDKEELLHRQRAQMFGNMKFLCELYTHHCLQENIILECIRSLLADKQDMNYEILTHMVTKLGRFLVAQLSVEDTYKPKKPKVLTVDYIESLVVEIE